jgi:hypothetical protein
MTDIRAYSWIVIGVAVSFIIPVIIQSLRPMPPGSKSVSGMSRFWAIAKPYFLMAVASVLLAIVTLAIAKSSNVDLGAWYKAFLLGYFWDSTVQKFKS